MEIKKAEEALLNYFRQNGFFQARIDVEVRPDTVHGLANVDFKTTLGLRAKFGDVSVEGATSEEARQIQNFLRSFRA